MWVILEIAKDPSLLAAVREEVATAYMIDSETGSRRVEAEKLMTLPLLQSILTEAVRLHMNFKLMLNVNEQITMDGFTLRKGSMLQAPMLVAHHDEAAQTIRPRSSGRSDTSSIFTRKKETKLARSVGSANSR